MGETDSESTEFTREPLLTFPTDLIQLSLECHLLVCNHYQTVPSPDTNKKLSLSSPAHSALDCLQTEDKSKIPTATDSQRGASSFGNGIDKTLRFPCPHRQLPCVN